MPRVLRQLADHNARGFNDPFPAGVVDPRPRVRRAVLALAAPPDPAPAAQTAPEAPARRVAGPAPALPSRSAEGPAPGTRFLDEGTEWIVYRREGRRTWMPAPIKAYVELDVVYYYPAGAPEPTEESYLDYCEYSGVDEVLEWIAKTPSSLCAPTPVAAPAAASVVPPPTPALAAGLGPAPGTRFVDEGKLFVVFRREPRNMASNALGSKEVHKERDVVYYYGADSRVPDETSYLDVCHFKGVIEVRELIARSKVYTCEPCGRAFSNASALNGHQTNLVCRAALDRLRAPRKPAPEKAAPARSKVYTCEPCGRTFSHASGLNGHQTNLVCRAVLDRLRAQRKPAPEKAAPVFVRAATFVDDDDVDGERCPVCCTVSDLESTPCCGGLICSPCVSRTCENARKLFSCPFCKSQSAEFLTFAESLGADLKKMKQKESWTTKLAVAAEAPSCALGSACACPRGPYFDATGLPETRDRIGTAAWPLMKCVTCGQSCIHQCRREAA